MGYDVVDHCVGGEGHWAVTHICGIFEVVDHCVGGEGHWAMTYMCGYLKLCTGVWSGS